MINDEISDQASSILRIFGSDGLNDLYQDMHMIVAVWLENDTCGESLFEEPDNEKDLIRLLRSAILLSRIADKHVKKFDKISRRHWNFWKHCEQIAEQVGKID